MPPRLSIPNDSPSIIERAWSAWEGTQDIRTPSIEEPSAPTYSATLQEEVEEQNGAESKKESDLTASPEQSQPPRVAKNSPRQPEEERSEPKGTQNTDSTTEIPQAGVDPNSRKKLSFGVELEFNLAFQTPDEFITDPDPQDPRQIYGIIAIVMDSAYDETAARKEHAHHHITNSIKKAGVHCRAYWDEAGKKNDRPVMWMVKDDTSLMVWDEDYEFIAAEVISPPFFYCEEARLQISGICQLLTSNYRLHCNERCGTHIHVGNGHDGFTNQTLVHLMAMLWVFEERLEMLHPPRRRSGHSGNRYCPSLREASKLGVQVPSKPQGKREGLARILKLRAEESTLEVVELMSFESGRSNRLSYHVRNLNESKITNAEGLSTRTIEFRGHEGTVDPDRIVNWINVCVGLVEFADTVDSNLLERFLWSHVDDNHGWDWDDYKNYTVIDLLNAIGRPAEAEFYLKRFQDNPRLLSDDSEDEEEEEEEEESDHSSSASVVSDSSELVRRFLESEGGPSGT